MGGLTLAQLAGIEVALAEGHDEAAVFQQEGVDAATYRAADTAWKQALEHDDLEMRRFAELIAIAEDCQHRSVGALESEPRAWAALLTAGRRTGSVMEAGSALGLRRGDVSRLVRSWQARIAEDEALGVTLRTLVGRTAAPSAVRPEPAVLRPFPWSPMVEGRTPPPEPEHDPIQRLVFQVDGALPAERDVDVYAALVATSEASPADLPRALELCGLLESDWDRLREAWRERLQTDAEARTSFSARLADHRALCEELTR